MKNLLFLILSMVACTSSQEKTSQQISNPIQQPNNQETIVNKSYELVLDDDGIYVEKFDSTKIGEAIHSQSNVIYPIDKTPYNQNNVIYKVGSVFTYSYQYIDTLGRVHYSKKADDGWQFVSQHQWDKTTIKEVIIEVKPGTMSGVPDYNQTLISYTYPPNAFYSISGVIENEKNVWMHPPRDGLFSILELNPFPYIQAPYQVGNQWNWKLNIGSHWADKRWKEWDGNITNKYTYHIARKQAMQTQLGLLTCYEINAVAESEIGKTALIAYFNEKHGFVKLNYTNIDGSKLYLELVAHKEK